MSDEEAVRKWAMDEETLQIDGQVHSRNVKKVITLIKQSSLFVVITNYEYFIRLRRSTCLC